jgi:uncharacterized protein (TIGR03000 family)
MRDLIRQRLARAPLLAAAALLLSPAWVEAQLHEAPAVSRSPFFGYTPMMATVYGTGTVGASWPSPSMSSVTNAPFTNYPSTYSPIAPPAAAAYSQLYYQTGPGGYPQPSLGVSLTPLGANNSASLASAGPATIDILVPEGADVVIQNKRVALSGSGSIRRYQTPFLRNGALYSYDITASWTENGREYKESQRVVVRPGEAATVSFLAATTTSTLQGSTDLPR